MWCGSVRPAIKGVLSRIQTSSPPFKYVQFLIDEIIVSFLIAFYWFGAFADPYIERQANDAVLSGTWLFRVRLN
jgi:hypothetical protein